VTPSTSHKHGVVRRETTVSSGSLGKERRTSENKEGKERGRRRSKTNPLRTKGEKNPHQSHSGLNAPRRSKTKSVEFSATGGKKDFIMHEREEKRTGFQTRLGRVGSHLQKKRGEKKLNENNEKRRRIGSHRELSGRKGRPFHQLKKNPERGETVHYRCQQ